MKSSRRDTIAVLVGPIFLRNLKCLGKAPIILGKYLYNQ